MGTKTIGLFYNQGFDVLIGYESTPDKVEYFINNDYVLFYNQAHQCCGFNLLNASKHLTLPLKLGINNDNYDLLAELGTILKQEDYSFNNINQQPQFIVGKILERKKHPNSDKLNICQVDIGLSTEQIICGADNCDIDQLVVVARVGAIMPSGLKIVPSELRGVISNGMLCSERELGLPVTIIGKKIMLLSNQQYHLGNSFWKEYYNGQN
ncbi:tRNA-binding protein [Spiroplasma citri]|uniref:Putative trna binding domain protein n=1 Tax=Spiroplasma citri TaxID=2133 RepID=Q14Q55_SPICI|nr:tRNA-binding protein [Spiroplasma citri]WFG98218.1 tRNA-binding protein [Spiroplasma citri]CAK98374.1 putative trna binding domain protein [Spiroplasma citri]